MAAERLKFLNSISFNSQITSYTERESVGSSNFDELEIQVRDSQSQLSESKNCRADLHDVFSLSKLL